MAGVEHKMGCGHLGRAKAEVAEREYLLLLRREREREYLLLLRLQLQQQQGTRDESNLMKVIRILEQ